MVYLVDREKAVVFTFQNGKAKNKKEFTNGHVPQRVKVDEEHFFGRADKIARHIEDHLHRHFVSTTNFAEKYWEERQFDGIIIGTHKPLFSKITRHLPRKMKDHLIGKLVIHFKSPFGKTLDKLDAFTETYENNQEIKKYEKYFLNH